MRVRSTLVLAAVVSLLTLVVCSDDKPVAPTPALPASRTLTLHYDFRFAAQEGGYTVKKFEYADENGNVIEVKNPTSPWNRDLTLKTGDRVYMHAEIYYDSVISAVVQVTSPPNYETGYISEYADANNSPATFVVEIDQVFK